jgi:hypothetical protein
MNRYLIIFSLVMTCLFQPARGYETPVHAHMTKNGFDRSILSVNNQDIYQRLGFDRLEADYPFNAQNSLCDSYADPSPAWLTVFTAPNESEVKFRCVTSYEQRVMPLSYSGRQYAPLLPEFPTPPGATPHLRFEAWLMRGAIREDDVADRYFTTTDRPDVDPWVDRTRVFNHFYSPVTNSPDSVQVSAMGVGSLNWALGEADPFAGSSQIPDPTRGNHFSYMDARRAYFLALTYRELLPPGQPFPDVNARLESAIRMRLWSTTLKSVGHVVHLMQDQASPQHSRGEPHNHTCTFPGSEFNQDFVTRTFENFINFRLVSRYNNQVQGQPYIATNDCEEAKWLNEFDLGGQRVPENIAPWNNIYPTPMFAVQRKFFTTRAPTDPTDPALLPRATLNTRAGIGDYANRGFYTQDYQQGRYQSPPAPNSPEFVLGTNNPVFVPGKGQVRLQSMYWPVPDPIAGGFVDAGLDPAGRAPIASRSQWCILTSQYTTSCDLTTMLTLRNYNQMADMLIPRATAYTTGMINFFFRGKLEVTPIDQALFGVLNQTEPHTMDSAGFPRVPATGRIFGFTKIRLKVRNTTDVITESGTNANVPQTVGVGKLYAVARYHRNACYKPDLSGERVQRYAPAPQLIIDEPACGTLPTRTAYQEISVSAPLTIASTTDLPGGDGTTPAALEKLFDFSVDPIPVNATDLFIQVVYRGQLGAETDGIAVGIYDVREPTFVAAYNGTDYYSGATGWLPQVSGSVPQRGVDVLELCAGIPSRLVFRATGSAGNPAMDFPSQVPGVGLVAGVARLAVITARPLPNERFILRVQPKMLPPPSPLSFTGPYKGQQRQADRELYTGVGTNVLPAPSFCQAIPPTAGTSFWCFDPIQQRRGTRLGDLAQAVFYNSTGIVSPPDVDSVPLPPFAATKPLVGGTIEIAFNNSGALSNCPTQPALLNDPDAQAKQRWIELREEGLSVGIEIGDGVSPRQ